MLEPIYRASAESAEARARARSAGRARGRPDSQGRAPAPGRRVARRAPRSAARGVRRVRACAAVRQQQRPHAGVARAPGRAARRRGRELVALYDAEIARLREDSPELAIELALRLAKLCEVQIGSVDDAIARYRIVYEIEPTHAEALEALDRLYEATERWPELAEIVAREAEVAGSPDDVLNLQFRLGSAAADASSATCARRSSSTARSWRPRPSTRRRALRSRACSRRASSRLRSARSSSRCTGCRTPGTS